MSERAALARRPSEAGGSARESRIQRAQRPAWSAATPSHDIDQHPSGSGEQLDRPTRAYFEHGFGHDFSRIRLHSGPDARAQAAALNAQAFTSGNHIILGGGHEAAASTPRGRALLAHELAHVVQSDRNRSASPLKAVSDPSDPAEREADFAVDMIMSGRTARLREPPSALLSRQQAPPQAWGSGWFPSQGGQIPGVTTAPPPPGPALAGVWPPSPWLPEAVFEPPAARTPADAPKAFDAYIALSPAQRARAFEISFANGNLEGAIHALGPARARSSTYAKPVQELLRLIEERSTTASSGKSMAQMATTQAAFMKARPTAASGGGWGGAAKGKTRWEALTADQQKDWTKRGNAAIAKMVAHAAKAAPQLALTAASFELDFEAVDSVSLGAFATVGSKSGQNVAVGFEFTVICEVNPAYALSTVEHELHGHPIFDLAGTDTAGTIYDQAAAQVPGAPSGEETYHYYGSEIYSSLLEIPFFVPTVAAEAGKSVSLPGGKAETIKQLNPDPRDLIAGHLRAMRSKWDPSLHVPLLRGFWKRVSADPAIQTSALTAFSAILGRVLGATDAAKITAP